MAFIYVRENPNVSDPVGVLEKWLFAQGGVKGSERFSMRMSLFVSKGKRKVHVFGYDDGKGVGYIESGGVCSRMGEEVWTQMQRLDDWDGRLSYRVECVSYSVGKWNIVFASVRSGRPLFRIFVLFKSTIEFSGMDCRAEDAFPLNLKAFLSAWSLRKEHMEVHSGRKAASLHNFEGDEVDMHTRIAGSMSRKKFGMCIIEGLTWADVESKGEK
jgi:hypothetical protein